MPTTLIPFALFLSVFVFSFLLLILTTVCIFLHHLLKHTGIKYKYLWKIDGIILGIGSVFFSCLIIKLTINPTNISEIWILLIVLFLPMIGEIEYYRLLNKNTKRVRIIGKLNLIARTFSKKDWIKAYELVIIHRIMSNSNREDEIIFPDNNEEEDNDKYLNTATNILKKLGDRKAILDEAIETANSFLFMTFWWGVLGYFLGIILVHFELFN